MLASSAGAASTSPSRNATADGSLNPVVPWSRASHRSPRGLTGPQKSPSLSRGSPRGMTGSLSSLPMTSDGFRPGTGMPPLSAISTAQRPFSPGGVLGMEGALSEAESSNVWRPHNANAALSIDTFLEQTMLVRTDDAARCRVGLPSPTLVCLSARASLLSVSLCAFLPVCSVCVLVLCVCVSPLEHQC